MSAQHSRPIHLKQSGACAEIILDAPARRNALNLAMWAALPVLVRTVDADDAASCLIIHGGDTGHFAAGVDITEFERIYASEADTRQTTRTITDALRAIESCSKPVIAAIDGSCFGAGISLALACDIRIAGPTARFGLPPAKLGLVYPPHDTRRLLQTVGRSQAKRMLFSARTFTGQEALQIGLVDEVSETEDTLGQARAMAEEISANARWSIKAIKSMIGEIEGGENDEHLMDWLVEGAAGPSFREGYSAFLEKRKATFPKG